MTKTISTKLLEGAKARLVFDKAELKVVAGPDRGYTVALSTDAIVIGSSSRCDLVLHDQTVSGRHAEVRMTPRGYVISDLGSTNGLRVGALVIERAALTDGFRVQLGDSVLIVRSLGGTVTVPLAQGGEFAGLTAHSIKMRAFVAMIEQVAESDATVLIEGETGSGKELAAQALHHASARKAGPFVTFDCSTAKPALAQSELFGHERGAFTGAREARRGLLDEAEGGTLFLDEVAELPHDLQPLLLGVLERKRSRRVGGKSEITHDVRIVAATQRNLGEEIRKKTFRQDLFYRLNVARLKVPPLRERAEDLPVLAGEFARQAGVALAPEQLALFRAYDWPGNVRELASIIQRMALERKAPEELSRRSPKRSPLLYDERGALRPWLDARDHAALALERDYVVEVLARARGHLSHAAEMAKISRQSLTNLALKHGLHPRDRDDP